MHLSSHSSLPHCSGTETEEAIQVRIRTAVEELDKLKKASFFQYKIVNNSLEVRFCVVLCLLLCAALPPLLFSSPACFVLCDALRLLRVASVQRLSRGDFGVLPALASTCGLTTAGEAAARHAQSRRAPETQENAYPLHPVCFCRCACIVCPGHSGRCGAQHSRRTALAVCHQIFISS
jgi:hypothetical protein